MRRVCALLTTTDPLRASAHAKSTWKSIQHKAQVRKSALRAMRGEKATLQEHHRIGEGKGWT